MAKRIAKSAINWQLLSDSVPVEERPKLSAFRVKFDLMMRKLMDYPLDPPKIDWAYFKDRVMESGMVDNFQKEYEAFKIPYPPESATPKIDAYEKEVKEHIEKFKKESVERIKNYEKELEHIKSLLPYDQMTMEDFKDSFPDIAVDPLNKPTFWPHTPEEQLGYQEKVADKGEEKPPPKPKAEKKTK